MEEKEEKKLMDIFKKVVNTGISAAFMTEESIRSLVQELPLPKEMIQGLLQNAKATKTEFISSVKKELKTYLDKIDLSKEIDRVLENYDLEISANIKFQKKVPIVKATKNIRAKGHDKKSVKKSE